jgi:hypothetical protein
MSTRLAKPAAALGAPFTIEWRRISELRGDLRSAPAPSQMQICRLARAIEGFGFNIPIVIDRELCVVAGRGRVLAAQGLGWREVPTIRLDDLSPAQVRAFKLAHYRLAASWDDLLLAMQLKELTASEPVPSPTRRTANGPDRAVALRRARKVRVPSVNPPSAAP